jgi:hypothetical protein
MNNEKYIIGAYHAGDDPDERTMAALVQNGITDYRHVARKVSHTPRASTHLSDTIIV